MGPAPGPVKWDIAALAITIVLYLLFVWRLHFLAVRRTVLP